MNALQDNLCRVTDINSTSCITPESYESSSDYLAPRDDATVRTVRNVRTYAPYAPYALGACVGYLC